MDKLNDVKNKIMQLDGGAFQNLCDAYLTCKGYKSVFAYGMVSGTNKTAKGNPDSYFLAADGKYIFAMYTTQQTDFLRKAKEDLAKCFDFNETGVQENDIAEIIYCHTYARLSAGQSKQLHDLCMEKNILLTLIGLDELAHEIYLKYTRLAKDFLGISVDTGQISFIPDFVHQHDANKMSAPLNTEFMFREKDLKTAKENLSKSNILIILGPAGVGKTRFSLKLCEDFASENGYKTLCIKSNGLEIFEDLLAALVPESKYIVFIDDANELKGLRLVLSYLSTSTSDAKNIQKIIITVRDYAQEQVAKQVFEFERPETMKLDILNDKEVKKLVTASFGIMNPSYLERIATIANGNARLAMLAGKVASETDKLASIQDASELYENYYSKQIEDIIHSDTGLASAGIIAFFQVLYFDSLDALKPVFAAAEITSEQFISDIMQLHYKELVDLHDDKVVKISDQTFSNYLVKYVFIDKRIIPLSQIIEISFFINEKQTIMTCNTLLNIFGGDSVKEYVEEQIIIVWNNLSCNADKFLPFFKAFYIIRPIETLIFLKPLIEEETPHTVDIQSLVSQKIKSSATVGDSIIRILCGFENHPQLPVAVDLLLLFYQKRPDLFEDFFVAFASHFGVNKESVKYNYFTQKTVVERLCDEAKRPPNKEFLILFIRIAEQFLKLSFSGTEESRRSSFFFYTIFLTSCQSVLEYRYLLLTSLFEIYRNGDFQREIENLLMNYCNRQGPEVDYTIVKSEFEAVLPFLSLFSTDCLYHCMIAEHFFDVAQRIDYDCQAITYPFIESPKYKIFCALTAKSIAFRRLSYQEQRDFQKRCVKELVKNCSLAGFQNILQICREYIEIEIKKVYLLKFALEYAFEVFAENQQQYIDYVKAYIAVDTPCDISAAGIIQHLFTIISATQVKDLIVSSTFSQKNVWLWQFYVELPESELSPMWASDFLSYLHYPAKDIRTSSERQLIQIKKYECVDKDIILKASEIILEHYSESPLVFSLYFSAIINPLPSDIPEIINQYISNIDLLEDIYLKSIEYSSKYQATWDSEGILLSKIMKQDSDFLIDYVEMCLSKISRFHPYHDAWIERLAFLWKEESYLSYMNQVSDCLFEKTDSGCSPYYYVISGLLQHRKEDSEVLNRQECWIQSIIKHYYLDVQHMCCLFSALSDHQSVRRKNALTKFLSLNSDFSVFAQLQLEPLSWGGFGSMIPYMQERIDYLSSLIPLLSGLTFLEHRKKVEDKIAYWKALIKKEELEEFLESVTHF